MTRYSIRYSIPEYRTWQNMKDRCLNKRGRQWAEYGGKGITLDPRWHKFDNFLADMGPRPTPKHTIERVNNNLGYSKSNCKWATYTEQSRNRPSFVQFTKALADQVRQEYATGMFTYEELGVKYGVGKSHIGQIVRYKLWR